MVKLWNYFAKNTERKLGAEDLSQSLNLNKNYSFYTGDLMKRVLLLPLCTRDRQIVSIKKSVHSKYILYEISCNLLIYFGKFSSSQWPRQSDGHPALGVRHLPLARSWSTGTRRLRCSTEIRTHSTRSGNPTTARSWTL